MRIEEIHPAFEEAFNRRDLDAVMELYAPDAVMALPDGSRAVGVDAIRQVLGGILAAPGHMDIRTRYIVERDDLAMISCDWTLTSEGEVASATTAEVVQRQPDGGWLYILDFPQAVVTA
jgi:uncharacterized protein (TIGR02246 family)